MSKELIFESPFGIIWFHPETKILHHKVLQFMPDQEVKDFLMFGTRTLKEKGAQKWLSDDQTSKPISKDFMEWGMAEWFPQTIAAGWKYWAVVKPKQMISQMEIEKMAKDYGEMGIETRFFSTDEEALEWLENI